MLLSSSKQKHALIICDIQPELLKAVEESRRLRFLDALEICIDITKQAQDPIIFTGLRFPSSYENVPPEHKLFGGFRRLNQKLGDQKVNWFLQGYTKIEETIWHQATRADHVNEDVLAESTTVLWRQAHSPPEELVQKLKQLQIGRVTIVGLKAAYTVQAVAQRLCDEGLMVSIVRECVEDDTPERRDAMLTHLLPIYSDVMDLVDYSHQMIDEYVCSLQPKQTRFNYCCSVGRGGHAPLIMGYLLQRKTWKSFWNQEWYADVLGSSQYRCPLGKFRVNFCDEPQFSAVSMFLKGREWLDEKDKLLEIADGQYMPETYLVREGNRFVSVDNNGPPTGAGPWFLKETNKNGGRAIQMCSDASECLKLVEPTGRYVLQRHIQNPCLTVDGRKYHFKIYNLIFNKDRCWKLYTYKDAFLSMSTNPWSPTDLTKETQITTLRYKRLPAERDHVEDLGNDFGWKNTYTRSKEAIRELVFRAIQQGKVCERDGTPQFEMFSADVILDRSEKLYIIEFNFSPVLYDPNHSKNITTRGLRLYQEQYERLGADAPINDSKMIQDVISVVFDGKDAELTRWDAVGERVSAGSPPADAK